VGKISNSLSHFTQPLAVDFTAEDEEVLLEEGKQSEFDPTEGIIVEDLGPEAGELPYEDHFKDTEDCGPKDNEGVAKRVNFACTKRPAKEQFSSIQKKYLRPENCEFLKAPRVNPELWDDLLDKTKSREGSFQSFQKNIMKGVTPVVQLASKVVDAKKRKEDYIPLNDVYDLSVDALTLLGNSLYEFSMRRREMLKSEVASAYKSLCHESQPITTMLFLVTHCLRAFVIFRKLSEWLLKASSVTVVNRVLLPLGILSLRNLVLILLVPVRTQIMEGII